MDYKMSEKDRLTTRTLYKGISLNPDGSCSKCSDCYKCNVPVVDCPRVDNVLSRLAYYEDLDTQGRLSKLPCVAGDIVYAIRDKIIKGTVRYIDCNISQFNVHYEIFVSFPDMDGLVYYGEDFGERLFHTEEDAENHLKNCKKKKRSEYHGRQRKHPKA